MACILFTTLVWFSMVPVKSSGLAWRVWSINKTKFQDAIRRIHFKGERMINVCVDSYREIILASFNLSSESEKPLESLVMTMSATAFFSGDLEISSETTGEYFSENLPGSFCPFPAIEIKRSAGMKNTKMVSR
jgi:hypothetical protein